MTSVTKLGRYEIRSKLGAGGMGEVYLAEDTQLDRKVAIKILPAESIADDRAKSRLIREARAAAKLDHSNICSIYEVTEEDSRSFIVMQYVEGETLAARIQRKPLELREAVDIAAQVADALAEAHSVGIIHRDIKPENIMITARGQVKVMDFGLATVINDKGMLESQAGGRSCWFGMERYSSGHSNGAKFGYIRIRDGKSKNARRVVSMTARVRSMLTTRINNNSTWVFPGDGDKAFLATSLNHQHMKIREKLGLPKTSCYIHSAIQC